VRIIGPAFTRIAADGANLDHAIAHLQVGCPVKADQEQDGLRNQHTLRVPRLADRHSHGQLISECCKHNGRTSKTNEPGVSDFDAARSLWLQFVVMAGAFAAIKALTELTIASLAHRIGPWLRRVGKRFNHACGGVFVACGISDANPRLAGVTARVPGLLVG